MMIRYAVLLLCLLCAGPVLVEGGHGSSDLAEVKATDTGPIGPYCITVGPVMAYSILDGKDNPVKNVKITAFSPEGWVYYQRTDHDGCAVFTDMPFPSFPNGTRFTARAYTFTDPAWEKGQPIPELETAPGEIASFSAFIYLIPMALLVVLLLRARLHHRS